MSVKISTVMPVYNSSEYLRQAIESVLNQTLKEIELICVDDGSTDNSVEIIEEFQKKDSRIKLIKQENLHAGVARNNGLKYATGEYVHFMDSDDWLDITAYERLYERVRDTKEDICVFNYYRYNVLLDLYTPIKHYLREHTDVEECVCTSFNDEPEYFIYNTVVPWNKIYRHQFLIEGNFKFQNTLSANDRLFYFHTVTSSQSVKIYNAFLFYHRMGVDGQLTSHIQLPYLECHITSNEEIMKICKSLPKRIYGMIVDACMHDIFAWLCNESSGKMMLEFWKRLSEFFAKLDLSYSDLVHTRKCSLWWDSYIAIKEPLKPRERVIISLTSYPARIATVSKCIESLMIQSLRVKKIILWLANEQFPNGESDLPADLLELKDYTFEDGTKFEIRWCEDLGSYKKLIPLLREQHDAVIITADDDIIYDFDMAKRLYLSYLKYPDCVHAHRVTKMFVWKGDIIKAVEGGTHFYMGANPLNKLTGVGGVLYPKNCFYSDVLNVELFMKLASTNDNLWFWCMANLNGYYVRSIKNKIVKLNFIEGTQDVDLKYINERKENFYIQLKNLMDYYPRWREILENACSLSFEKIQYTGLIHSELYGLHKELYKLKSGFQNAVCEEVGLNNEEKDYSFYKSLSQTEYKRALKAWFMYLRGWELNFTHPATFSEKLQYLKLMDSTPLKGQLADKYAVREWVSEKIGKEYLVPLLGVYDNFDEIDFGALPDRFVLKCNHGCKYNIIVKDKSDLDLEDMKAQIEEWLNTNFAYRVGLELHYRYIQPKIIIEQFLENAEGDLCDYKFACFNGVVKFVWVDTGRYTDHRTTIFDINWNLLSFELEYPVDEDIPPKPRNLEKMIELAEKLAKGFSFVRVDFYQLDDGTIKFGEMTFTSGSGIDRFIPQYYDRVVGEMLEIKQGE